MDRVYIDNGKIVEVDVPSHGVVKLIIQDGKVIRTETTTSKKIKKSD